MTTHKFSTVKGRRARITRLDTCGAPLIGLRSTIVTGGFLRVTSKLEYEEGEKFEVRDAWGDFCVNEQDDPRIKGADIEVEWCHVDPDVYDVTLGARVALAVAGDSDFAAVGDSVGYGLGVDTVPGNFALETWAKVAGGACNEEGDPTWLYTVWPWVKNGAIGDYELKRGTASYNETARGNGAAAAWDVTPYATAPFPGTGIPAGEVFFQRLTSVQPPAVTAGAVALA